jgi:hypothetical protein
VIEGLGSSEPIWVSGGVRSALEASGLSGSGSPQGMVTLPQRRVSFSEQLPFTPAGGG